MTIEQAIFETLSGDAGVAAIVGDRIYPDWNEVPLEDLADFVVYQLESMTAESALGFPGDAMYVSTYSITCAARSSDQKALLADACLQAMYSRPVDSDVTVLDSRLQSMRDETTEEAIEIGIRVRSVYWEITWKRT